MSTEAWKILLVGLLCGASCASEGGDGTLSVRISGEAAAQSGYPAGEGEDQIAFTDGWTLDFQKVIVSVTTFSMSTSDGEDANLAADAVVVDLHQGTPELWRFDGLAAQRWDSVNYRYTKPPARARIVNDVSDEDLTRMQDEGFSLLMEGTARKADRDVKFSWGFPLAIDVMHCQNGLDGTDGIVVRDNAVTNGEITIHLDHLFFDNWAVAEPNLRFDALAEMAPEGRPLSLSDLRAQDNLSDLKGADGEPLDLAYDPGSAFHPVPTNLDEFINAAAETTGHWNGEGHCEYHRL
jgi:hypothetical protein